MIRAITTSLHQFSNHVSVTVDKEFNPARFASTPIALRLSTRLLTFTTGKNGRAAQDPTTHVSPVHVHHHRKQEHAHAPQNHDAHPDPSMTAHQAHQVPHGDAYSKNMDGDDTRNRGAQAGNTAAQAAGHNQKAGATKSKVDKEELARLVAEENESKGKLPRYPGLDRWQLIEKMGDGAFSNVYRARDLDGKAGEVAIKVVRKFEMNTSQVSIDFLWSLSCLRLLSLANMRGVLGRRSPSSGLQKATEGRRGAHNFSLRQTDSNPMMCHPCFFTTGPCLGLLPFRC